MSVTWDEDDIENLALCGWREARGEGAYGWRAVMWVCKNRVGASGFPNMLHAVIYQKNAYTSMSRPSDPDYYAKPADTDTAYEQCLEDAPKILSGVLPDPTKGASYYCNPDATKPGWFTEYISGSDFKGLPAHPFIIQIGKQLFYK